MGNPSRLARFEQVVLPHLNTAYNLARWLTGNDHDAEDVVQETFLRALEYFAAFRGEDGRAWLLAAVRNTCYTWLKKNRGHRPLALDEGRQNAVVDTDDPAAMQSRTEDALLVRQGLAELVPEFREVLVLREIEGLSYRDIAAVIDVPLGTVMSRLARARSALQKWLAERLHKEP